MSWKSEMALLTGAGIGAYWGEIRPNGFKVKKTGGTASGPIPKAIQINETGRAPCRAATGARAIWGGLPWFHDDIFEWIKAKDWPQYLKDAKASDPSIPAPLDMTNISVCLDDAFFAFYEGDVDSGFLHLDDQAPDWMRADDGGLKPEYVDKDWVQWARDVYGDTVDSMTQTGEPGFSVDTGDQWNEKLRNACTEIVSADDSDICNLGGLVLSRFDDPAEFGEAVKLGVLYLTAGSVYSHVPYDKVDEVRTKNRRLGLDLMGVHEFLLMRGLKYGTDEAEAALEPYMREYRKSLEYAHEWQREAGLSPVGRDQRGVAHRHARHRRRDDHVVGARDLHGLRAPRHHVQGAHQRRAHRALRRRPDGRAAAQARATSCPRMTSRTQRHARAGLRAPLQDAGVRAGAGRPGDLDDGQPAARDGRRGRARRVRRDADEVPAQAARDHGLPGRRHRRPADRARAAGRGAGLRLPRRGGRGEVRQRRLRHLGEYDLAMAKRGRPAQGTNSVKKLVKISAGGDNVRTSGGSVPRVNNNKKRKTT
jgi:hypothetical protein